MKPNKEGSESVEEYIKRLFPCEKPCDSYGVCDNCSGASLIRVGASLASKDYDKALSALKHIAPILKYISVATIGQRYTSKEVIEAEKVLTKLKADFPELFKDV